MLVEIMGRMTNTLGVDSCLLKEESVGLCSQRLAPFHREVLFHGAHRAVCRGGQTLCFGGCAARLPLLRLLFASAIFPSYLYGYFFCCTLFNA